MMMMMSKTCSLPLHQACCLRRKPLASKVGTRCKLRLTLAAATLVPRNAVENMSEIVRLDCGKRLSEATVHNKTVYLAGQVPENTNADAKGQTEQCLKCIDDLLARAGTDKSRLLSCQIYLVDINDFPALNEAWDAWVPAGATPARATVAGVKLADPGWKVEIVAVAALP